MTTEDAAQKELESLHAQVATLTQLLSVQRAQYMEQAGRLEKVIDELKHRAAALAQSEDAQRRQSAILHWMLDNMADGLVVLDAEGTHLLSNRSADAIIGDLAMGLPRPAEPLAEGRARLLLADEVTPCPVESEPLLRALRGEEVREEELFIRRPSPAEGAFVSVNATPLLDESGIQGAVAVFRDITDRKRQQDKLETKQRELYDAERARNEALERLQESQADLIQRQQLALQELSTPILDLWENVLALPVIGVVDSSRSAQIMERLLSEIVARRSRYVIIDVTGVEVIDTQTASHFLRIARTVELLGARCVLTGMRPAVAQTVVQLNVDLKQVLTLRSLRQGLRYCVARMQEADRDARSEEPVT